MNLFGNYRNIKVIICVLMTSIALILRDIVGIDINQYVIFLFMSIFFIVLSKRDAHLYLAYTCGIIFGVNAYILLIGMLTIILKDFRQIKKDITFLLFFLILFLWEVCNTFLNYSSPEFSVLLLYAAYLLVFFYYFFISKVRPENKDTLLYYSLGLGVALLIVSIGILRNPMELIFDSNAESRAAMGFVDNQTRTHFYANANTIAYFSIVLLSLVLSLRKSIFKPNALFYSLLIISLLAGVLSTSRTWILLCIMILITLFLLGSSSTKFKSILISLAIFVVIVYFFPNFVTVAFDGFRSRFELGNIETAGNRTELMKEYSMFMTTHPEYVLQGTGAVYYKSIAQCSNSIHNAFQQIYVSYGLLGCVFFLLSLFISLRQREPNNSIIYYVPFISAIMFVQSIQFLNPFYLMIPIALTSVAFKIRTDI